jgi:ElaB/YqjD/DUF883 family membrane-anchored ribosome-binding protein
MNSETNNYETPKQQTAGEPGSISASVDSALERGAENYRKAEQTVSEAYDKTTKAVSGTYQHAKSYSDENPGKTIFLALGIGVGIGILLGASTYRSRSSRIAEPVVNALSDIALAYFR